MRKLKTPNEWKEAKKKNNIKTYHQQHNSNSSSTRNLLNSDRIKVSVNTITTRAYINVYGSQALYFFVYMIAWCCCLFFLFSFILLAVFCPRMLLCIHSKAIERAAHKIFRGNIYEDHRPQSRPLVVRIYMCIICWYRNAERKRANSLCSKCAVHHHYKSEETILF